MSNYKFYRFLCDFFGATWVSESVPLWESHFQDLQETFMDMSGRQLVTHIHDTYRDIWDTELKIDNEIIRRY